jgi:diacylglycerol O-acyltransferase / wax synthase
MANPPAPAPEGAPEPLSPEDLGFWYADQPRQRTTMAMLLRLDRRPEPERLRAAAWRAVEAVPRLRQRVVDAPFDLARPRWEEDPTFDLDFHVRRYSLPGDVDAGDALTGLFRTAGPIYERPFDRTRPLWELIEIEGPDGGAAVFFRLHHAVADGVGGNAILAALTDADRGGELLPPPPRKTPGAWPETAWSERLAEAVVCRTREQLGLAQDLAGTLWSAAGDPRTLARVGAVLGQLVEDLRFRSGSPLRAFGRSRLLAGLDLPFEPLRELRRAARVRMVDVLLTGVAGAVAAWHRTHGMGQVRELLTLVPINLRPRDEQGAAAGIGNRATGIQVRLPLHLRNPRRRLREIHRRVEARRTHPAADAFPQLAAALAVLPRPLYRALAYRASEGVDLIVTNVPGIPTARYLAGAEITGAYPFAPVAPHCPVSIALYGYRGRLFIGLDADGTAMPDVDTFRDLLGESFAALVEGTAHSG